MMVNVFVNVSLGDPNKNFNKQTIMKKSLINMRLRLITIVYWALSILPGVCAVVFLQWRYFKVFRKLWKWVFDTFTLALDGYLIANGY